MAAPDPYDSARLRCPQGRQEGDGRGIWGGAESEVRSGLARCSRTQRHRHPPGATAPALTILSPWKRAATSAPPAHFRPAPCASPREGRGQGRWGRWFL